MKIDGPLQINVVDDEATHLRTLEVDFTAEFQALELEKQGNEMKQHIQTLFQYSESLADNDANKTGVVLIMQLCEQLLPYIQQDEINLAETIKIEMDAGDAPAEFSFPLTDFKVN